MENIKYQVCDDVRGFMYRKLDKQSKFLSLSHSTNKVFDAVGSEVWDWVYYRVSWRVLWMVDKEL